MCNNRITLSHGITEILKFEDRRPELNFRLIPRYGLKDGFADVLLSNNEIVVLKLMMTFDQTFDDVMKMSMNRKTEEFQTTINTVHKIILSIDPNTLLLFRQ